MPLFIYDVSQLVTMKWIDTEPVGRVTAPGTLNTRDLVAGRLSCVDISIRHQSAGAFKANIQSAAGPRQPDRDIHH